MADPMRSTFAQPTPDSILEPLTFYEQRVSLPYHNSLSHGPYSLIEASYQVDGNCVQVDLRLEEVPIDYSKLSHHYSEEVTAAMNWAGIMISKERQTAKDTNRYARWESVDDAIYDLQPAKKNENLDGLKKLGRRLKAADQACYSIFTVFKPGLERCAPERVSEVTRNINAELDKIDQLKSQSKYDECKAALKDLSTPFFIHSTMLCMAANDDLLSADGRAINSCIIHAKVGSSKGVKYWIKLLNKGLEIQNVPDWTKDFLRHYLNRLQDESALCEYLVRLYRLRQSEFTGSVRQSVSKQAAGNHNGRKRNIIQERLESAKSMPPAIQSAAEAFWAYGAKHQVKKIVKKRSGKNSEYQSSNNHDQNAKIINSVTISKLEHPVQDPVTGTTYDQEITLPSGLKVPYLNPMGHCDLPLLQGKRTKVKNPSGLGYSDIIEARFRRERFFFCLDQVNDTIKLVETTSNKVKATENFQTGVPFEALVPLWVDYYEGRYSLQHCCESLRRQTGIYMVPSTMEETLKRIDPLMQKLASLIEEAMTLSNDVNQFDESPFPMWISSGECDRKGNLKVRQSYYVMVNVAPFSANFKGIVYKGCESRSKSSFIKNFGKAFKHSKAIVSDRYASYGSIMAALDSLNQYCWAHLFRELAKPAMPFLKHMSDMEADFIKELTKQGKYDRKKGFTKDQQAEFDKKLQEYWKEIPKAIEAIINACYLITLIFAVEQHVAQVWAEAFERSTHAAKYGTLSKRGRNKALRKVRQLRNRFSREFVDLLDEEIAKAQTEEGHDLTEVETAVAYYLNGIDGFKTFLEHPEVPIDNNASERGVKHIMPIRKQQRVNQSPQSLKQACHFHTCLQTMLKQGYSRKSFIEMLKYMLDKLFMHTLEQAANECYRDKGNLDGLDGRLRQINYLTYLHSFPVAKHFLDYLAIARQNELEHTGTVIHPWPEATVQKVLAKEQEDMASDTKAYQQAYTAQKASALANLAKARAAKAVRKQAVKAHYSSEITTAECEPEVTEMTSSLGLTEDLKDSA